ncbi:MAG: WD40 repeat domain-containing protein, partial [Planctomycetota bacterium]
LADVVSQDPDRLSAGRRWDLGSEVCEEREHNELSFIRIEPSLEQSHGKSPIGTLGSGRSDESYGKGSVASSTTPEIDWQYQSPILRVRRSRSQSLYPTSSTATIFESFQPREVADAACSPDGRWLAVTGVGQQVVELFDLTHQNAPRQFAIEEPNQTLCFAPDSTCLAVGGSSVYECFPVDGFEREFRYQFEGPATSRPGIAWSPKGDLIAVTHRMDMIDLIETAAGDCVLSLSVPQNGSWLHFSRDGQKLYCRDSNFRLVEWSLGRLRSELDQMGLGW